MCVLFFLSNVCIPAYANVYFKTTIIKQNIKIILIAGVPSSQALPGYLITAPPSVCVPDVLGVLVVWIQKQNQISRLVLAEFFPRFPSQIWVSDSTFVTFFTPRDPIACAQVKVPPF